MQWKKSLHFGFCLLVFFLGKRNPIEEHRRQEVGAEGSDHNTKDHVDGEQLDVATGQDGKRKDRQDGGQRTE